jgi:hypothetical protein
LHKSKTYEDALAKAKSDLDTYQKEMCKSKRKAAMAEIDADDARKNELVEKFIGVADEIFDEFVKNMPKKQVVTTTTTSAKEILDKAVDVDTTVVVPTETQKTLVAKASEWIGSTLSNPKDKKGE